MVLDEKTKRMDVPRVALTMGDVAGIGPEVIARACSTDQTWDCCQPIVFGHPAVLERAARLVDATFSMVEIADVSEAASRPGCVSVYNPAGDAAALVAPGVVDRRSGHAAYEYLTAAIDAAHQGAVAAITTAPLNKLALHQAGIPFPGHTEILADACGVRQFAMMLYLPAGHSVISPFGLGIAHVTLHTSIASVPRLLSTAAVADKLDLIDRFLKQIDCGQPRIGVCALNPHAGEGGLFGDEEARVIRPAIEQARSAGQDVAGPLPADTLLQRAVAGEFDGVVAMFHDQGHIALKLIARDQAVNVTLGLPIVRTSPSHGTAFDIAWQGKASERGLIEAIRVASLLAQYRQVSKTT